MTWRAGRRSLVRSALAATAATLLVAGTAQAATVTVGSPLTANFSGTLALVTAHTVTNLGLPPPANAASPVDGTVISWRFIGSPGPFAPRVIRPAGATTYTGAGTGNPEPSAGSSIISGPFTTNLPIRRGDLFGVNTNPLSELRGAGTAGATTGVWDPPLADGGAGSAPTNTFVNFETAISAVVRYCLVPKLKGKKPKAARNALRAADCTVGRAKKTKKERKKKKVISQGFATGSSISDTEPVNFKVSRKRK